jgi:hypothetical protein
MRVVNVPSREFKQSDLHGIMAVHRIDFKRQAVIVAFGQGRLLAAACVGSATTRGSWYLHDCHAPSCVALTISLPHSLR